MRLRPWEAGDGYLIRHLTALEYEGNRIASYGYQMVTIDVLELGHRAAAAITTENRR